MLGVCVPLLRLKDRACTTAQADILSQPSFRIQATRADSFYDAGREIRHDNKEMAVGSESRALRFTEIESFVLLRRD